MTSCWSPEPLARTFANARLKQHSPRSKPHSSSDHLSHPGVSAEGRQKKRRSAWLQCYHASDDFPDRSASCTARKTYRTRTSTGTAVKRGHSRVRHQSRASETYLPISVSRAFRRRCTEALVIVGIVILAPAAQALALRPEPGNALSIPTWTVHIASLLEWALGMFLVWRYGDLTGNKSWRWLAWGMLPLHMSGICAITYHFFYNSNDLEVLVAVQALLTCIGNFSLWVAAYKINEAQAHLNLTSKSAASASTPALIPMKDEENVPEARPVLDRAESMPGERLANTWREIPAKNPINDSQPKQPRGQSIEIQDFFLFEAANFDIEWSDAMLVLQILGSSCAGAFIVKYGSLLIDVPFEPSSSTAAVLISIPTMLTVVLLLAYKRY
ncbi:hypothetical protein CYMTET_50928 [Cymbomonas tetramitiformis]|uniref:Ycf49-like protein n=1 Tax=Cymbomonas tetramitiformis TaxID=36881 RepID=A0AAE0BM34_9CHLO|nr:hypothetical protein CYMTET_50928 [Cymbomonas tetramitiformis]